MKIYHWSRLTRRLVIAIVTAYASDSTSSNSNPLNQVSFLLGDKETLQVLYSHPSARDTHKNLAQTIEHYLNQRLWRDSINRGVAQVSVDNRGLYYATLNGSANNLDDYRTKIPAFLNIGLVAARAVTQLKAKRLWDEEQWQLFLPLGLAIINQRSVQLLHFPPDYSLDEQDYLTSKTSQRWQTLLKLNAVAADQVTLYESILDITPIAAPANAGSNLSETYRYFEPYVVDMLSLLLKIDDGSASTLPIVAYGGPVRRWVEDYFKLKDFGVNRFAMVAITDEIQAPILGANHPSYIWYAKQNGRSAAMAVMAQDLISACWQAKMGRDIGSDGALTLSQCSDYWAAKPMTVCIHMEIQAFDKSEIDAKAICQKSIPSTATLTEQLTRQGS